MKLILLLIAASLCSCSTANISTKHVDGKIVECQASYFSAFKEMDTASMSACGGKGGTAGTKVNTALAGELFKALVMVP